MPATVETTGNVSGNVRLPLLASQVCDLRQAGKDISSIARELGISRPTVRKYLAIGEITKGCQDKLQPIAEAALVAIDSQIRKGDGKLALDFAKCTIFAEQRTTYNIAGDATIQSIAGMMPSRTQPAIEEAAKPPATSLGLSVQANFSQFSTEQLEAELARRKAADTVLDAEVVAEASDAPAR